MHSARALPVVLIALVLVPAAILAGLSLNTTAGYRAEVDARLRRELDEMQETLGSLARTLVEQDAAATQRQVQEAADLVARRLPFEPASVVFAAVRREPLPLPDNRAPSNWRLRVIDARGQTVIPAPFDPDEAGHKGSDRDRLLDNFRRQADAALFGTGSLAAAERVWNEARARFEDDDLRAVADVELAWLAVRATGDAEHARVAFETLQRRWPHAVLDRTGRPWVLLALAASVGLPAAAGVVKRLRAGGALDTIPLTDEERRRLDWAPQGIGVTDTGSVAQDAWTAPLPAGLTLELRRLLPGADDLAGVLLEAVQRRWPAGRPLPWFGSPGEMRTWMVATQAHDARARWHDLLLPGGRSRKVLLIHPEAGTLDAALATRRNWTIAGVAALFVLVGLGLHLTLRALAREREARRLKDDFLANVSHELRTPLTAVCLHADLLAEASLPEERRRGHAEVVRAEGARLAAMVDDLLDFAALERGSRRLEIEPVDLVAAVHRCVEPFRVLAEREGVVLDVRAGGDEATALADPHGLARILANLVGNAWKHGRPSRDGAPGRIALEVSGGRVLVRDDGPGIPASDREHLFERFRRGAASSKTRGVGLGLALSRDLARAMGGDLVLVEDPEATVFRLTLPAAPSAPPAPSTGSGPEGPPERPA